MAQYEHLPIYKKAMDIAVHVEKIVLGFNRHHKYQLGADMRRLAQRNVCLIIEANQGLERRAQLLQVLRQNIEALKVTMRLAKELKAFKSLNAYLFIVEAVLELARQNEAWLRSVINKEFNAAKAPVRKGAKPC